jgi:hypothetical protein
MDPAPVLNFLAEKEALQLRQTKTDYRGHRF